MEKVDVVINMYGKPYQTLVTIKSLMQHSGHHIDKIFLIQEAIQPYVFNVKAILDEFPGIIHFKPSYFHFTSNHKPKKFKNKKYRNSLRYQYGIENSNKKHVFISHNDVLYIDDVIGYFLENIGGNVGIGEIGQCWNCSMNFAGVCNSEKVKDFNFSYEEIDGFFNQFPPVRKYPIDKMNPYPLPECRLNEWFCLINNEINRKETIPSGEIVPFGTYINGTDVAVEWFRQMFLKGFRFKNIETKAHAIHAYFSNNNNGHSALFDSNKYMNEEELAKKYLLENYQFQSLKEPSFLDYMNSKLDILLYKVLK